MQSKKREGESDIGFFFKNVAAAAFSACFAEVVTIPMDTAKVRLQIQSVVEGQAPKYNGLVSTTKLIAAEEGALALWGGLSAGLQRQCVFAGLRIGMYVPIRDWVTGPLPEGVNPSLLQKIAAGIISGSIAITVANPTDVVKIRLQAQGAKAYLGVPPQYNGSIDCYKQIVAKDGIKGLWIGWGPNVMRNSIINAAELASYDQYKQMVLESGFLPDGIPCHLLCASMAGFTACIIGSPVDVLKTRLMNAEKGMYANPIDCVAKTFKNEGAGAFYKGFGPNVGRLAGWNCVMFLTLEQVKKQFF